MSSHWNALKALVGSWVPLCLEMLMERAWSCVMEPSCCREAEATNHVAVDLTNIPTTPGMKRRMVLSSISKPTGLTARMCRLTLHSLGGLHIVHATQQVA